MKEYAHVSISIGVGALLLSLFNLVLKVGLLFFLMLFVFGLLAKVNDVLDHKLYSRHERHFLTHSPLSPLLIIIAILVGLGFGLLNVFFGIYVGIITYLIFFLHFLLDALNPSGVPVLLNGKVKLSMIPYDNKGINLLLFLIGVILLLIGTVIFFA